MTAPAKTPGKTGVRIELRDAIAEKLRAICHARGETASMVIDRWIVQADAMGEIKPATATSDPLELLKRRMGL